MQNLPVKGMISVMWGKLRQNQAQSLHLMVVEELGSISVTQDDTNSAEVITCSV